MPGLKPWHIIVVVLVVLLLFGSKRLPDLARSVGRSLRIIKAETRTLMDDDLASKAEPRTARAPLTISDDEPSPLAESPTSTRDK
ncbi:MAG: Sec-independent protein translocase subunit TatA [Micromonosporaceae bacterium]|nr:Sec-independent protein translocase subunit TatA [Micromonosporaceae bacterium]